MRCMACGTEMTLISVVPDETMMVRGFEHHTYMCPACADVEKRFVFTKHEEKNESADAPVPTPPPVAAPPVQDQPTDARSLLQRVMSASWLTGGPTPRR